MCVCVCACSFWNVQVFRLRRNTVNERQPSINILRPLNIFSQVWASALYIYILHQVRDDARDTVDGEYPSLTPCIFLFESTGTISLSTATAQNVVEIAKTSQNLRGDFILIPLVLNIPPSKFIKVSLYYRRETPYCTEIADYALFQYNKLKQSVFNERRINL